VPNVTSTSAPHLISADSKKTQTTFFVSAAVVFVFAVAAVLVAWKTRSRKPGKPKILVTTPEELMSFL
jgi:hypothetical protein